MSDFGRQYYKGPNLNLALQNIKENVRLIWENPQHLHYTDHGLRHSETIIKMLADVLKGQPVRLSRVAWFLLQAAAYLHDVGMQCTDKDLLQREARFPQSFDLPLSPSLLENIRQAHHRLSYSMIMAACADQGREKYPFLHKALIGLSSENAMIEAIAVLSLAHKDEPDDLRLDSLGSAIPDYDSAFGPAIGYDTALDHITALGHDPAFAHNYGPGTHGPVNLRLLCTLLRFGDALDADSTRIRMDRFTGMSGLLPPERQIHFWKHYFVSNVVIKGGLVERLLNLILRREFFIHIDSAKRTVFDFL